MKILWSVVVVLTILFLVLTMFTMAAPSLPFAFNAVFLLMLAYVCALLPSSWIQSMKRRKRAERLTDMLVRLMK